MRASRWPSVATQRSTGPSGPCGGVHVDAVQVVAGLLGRDRELRLVEQPPQHRGRAGEVGLVLGARHDREVLARQRREAEVRASGADLEPAGDAVVGRARPSPRPAACGRSRAACGRRPCVAPARLTIAGARSITSMSRSVARKLTWSPSASISTFARIGMVLRRSTTDCARLMALRRALRSTLSFMLSPFAWVRRSGRLAVARTVTLPICGEEASGCEGGAISHAHFHDKALKSTRLHLRFDLAAELALRFTPRASAAAARRPRRSARRWRAAPRSCGPRG